MQVYDEQIKNILQNKTKDLEQILEAHVIFFYGPIQQGVETIFKDSVERLKFENTKQKRIAIFLNTGGGIVEIVEKLVDIIRFHYSEVYFVVPDYAMSAGTIFCMSGNKIFMDYSSSLGPIDPQVFNSKENDFVPALGYLDKVENMLEKSQKNQLTDAEFFILQNLDLAMLSRYEQARNLTVTLLKKWLVNYKFNDWEIHESNGKAVTLKEKEARAEEIAIALGDNKSWHSHNRMIGINTLNQLRLKIDDYSFNEELRSKIKSCNDFLVEYIARENYRVFIHSF
jgi:membrane-bound ClpP family serine protease